MKMRQSSDVGKTYIADSPIAVSVPAIMVDGYQWSITDKEAISYIQICTENQRLREENARLKALIAASQENPSDVYDDDKDYIPFEPHSRRQVKIKVTNLGRWTFPIILDEDE